jgi:hypothetical protein
VYDDYMSDKKDFKKLRRTLQAAGLTVVASGNGHFKAYRGKELVTVMGGSPGGGRGLRNQRAHLKRKGITI